jgi:2-hydroxy-6-oxonona-2,4-dienedioate hydrolase/2-hydroxy-6-oxo-6-(2'-carboxyphenyl)-hexa-2,4-dienoate hydrolase
MTRVLTLDARPTVRPLEDWPPVSVELIGTQTRIVRGERFHHRVIEAGSPDAPALVLIHGVGGHAETWARNLHNLGERFHVLAIDALFHGYSSQEPFVSTKWLDLMTIQAAGVHELIKTLGHDKAYVAGESMGAGIAFEYGWQYPESCLGVVLNTGFGLVKLKRDDFREQPADMAALGRLSKAVMENLTFDNMRARMEWLVAEPKRMTDEMVAIRLRLYQDPQIFECIKRVYSCDWYGDPQRTEEDCARYPSPSLVFWTEFNPGEGPDKGRYYADLLPDAYFYNMDDAAHWPQWERPEEHDAVIFEWVDRIS